MTILFTDLSVIEKDSMANFDAIADTSFMHVDMGLNPVKISDKMGFNAY